MTGAWDAMLAAEVDNPLQRRRALARLSKPELIDIIQDFEAGAAGAALGSTHAPASETPARTVTVIGDSRLTYFPENHEEWCHTITGCTEADHCTCNHEIRRQS